MRALFFKLLFWSGIGPISICIQRIKRKAPIFLFHRISNTYDRFTEPIPTDRFEDILKKITYFYTPQKLELLEKQTNQISKKAAFVCFDDGLEDFYLNAFPILKKHSIPVTLFVPTGKVGTENSIWNNQLFELALSFTTKTTVFNSNIEIEFNPQAPNYYQQVMKIHKHLCQNYSIEDIYAFLNQGFSILKEKYALEKANMCSWNTYIELQKNNVNIQCHTHNHLYLKGKSEKVIEQEFRTSKELLEKHLNKSINWVAYPVGGYNQQVIALAKKYFTLGFSVDEKYLDINLLGKEAYNHTLPRFNIQDKTFEEMYFRTIGFHAFISKLKQL